MTHASGVDVTQDVIAKWQDLQEDDSVRFLKLGLSKEAFHIEKIVQAVGDWKADFKLISPTLAKDSPNYIIYRRGDANWILMNYIPSASSIRSRMIFASSRDTVKETLGGDNFTDLYFGSDAVDFNFEDFQMATAGVDDSLAMSNAEIDARNEAMEELAPNFSVSNVHAVKFPIMESAKDALESLDSSSNNMIVLGVDKKTETVVLVKECSANPDEVCGILGGEKPAYVFIRYDHKFEGKSQKAIVFIYWCPLTANVRTKMLFSTVKAAVLEQAAELGATPTKKLECTESDEVSVEIFEELLHPKAVVKNTFAKPKRAGRGTRPARRPRASRRSTKS